MNARTIPCTIVGWWCESPIKLPKAVTTPLGGRVTVITVCVDVHYVIEGGEIVVCGASLSQPEGSNVAAQRRGEAWRASRICPDSQLLQMVQSELAADGSRLRKAMLARWHEAHRDENTRSLTETLNRQSTAEQVADLVRAAGRETEIIFNYTKPDGSSEIRHVSIEVVSGQSLRAVDHKDGTLKTFRLDRITEARPANSFRLDGITEARPANKRTSKKGCLTVLTLLGVAIGMFCAWYACLLGHKS